MPLKSTSLQAEHAHLPTGGLGLNVQGRGHKNLPLLLSAHNYFWSAELVETTRKFPQISYFNALLPNLPQKALLRCFISPLPHNFCGFLDAVPTIFNHTIHPLMLWGCFSSCSAYKICRADALAYTLPMWTHRLVFQFNSKPLQIHSRPKSFLPPWLLNFIIVRLPHCHTPCSLQPLVCALVLPHPHPKFADSKCTAPQTSCTQGAGPLKGDPSNGAV